MNDVMTRDQLYDHLKETDGANEIFEEARERKTTRYQVMQERSPLPDQQYMPTNVISDMLMRDDLRVQDSPAGPSSKMNEFKKAYQRALFLDHLEYRYNGRFMTQYLNNDQVSVAERIQARESSTTASGFTADRPWRPYNEFPLMDQSKIEPDIPLNAIVTTTDTSAEIDGRIPEYQTPAANEESPIVEEGADIPLSRIKLGQRTVDMRRIGLGIQYSDIFTANAVRASALARWVDRRAVRDEIFLVNEALKVVTNGVPAGATISDPITATDVLEIQTSFRNGNVADRIIGRKSAAIKYAIASRAAIVSTAASATSAPAELGGGIGALAELLARPTFANQMSRLEQLYYLNDTDAGEADIDVDRLLLLDSITTIGMLLHSGDPYDRTDFHAQSATERRFFAMWFGFYLQTDAPRILYTIP